MKIHYSAEAWKEILQPTKKYQDISDLLKFR